MASENSIAVRLGSCAVRPDTAKSGRVGARHLPPVAKHSRCPKSSRGRLEFPWPAPEVGGKCGRTALSRRASERQSGIGGGSWPVPRLDNPFHGIKDSPRLLIVADRHVVERLRDERPQFAAEEMGVSVALTVRGLKGMIAVLVGVEDRRLEREIRASRRFAQRRRHDPKSVATADDPRRTEVANHHRLDDSVLDLERHHGLAPFARRYWPLILSTTPAATSLCSAMRVMAGVRPALPWLVCRCTSSSEAVPDTLAR